jgi:hypothetical protein
VSSQPVSSRWSFLIAVLTAVVFGVFSMTVLIAIGDWLPLYLGEMAWIANGIGSILILRLMRPQTSSATMAVMLVFMLAITYIHSAIVSWYVLGDRL